ncbi:PEP-CTERM sorting domain-containing protein [bacterium]|nr:PEP-CTERM sorting domain-containing protein [Akkermansiaceae bacterium]MDB4322381.1 PEP-CTERM sorting domain-containing protein [Akkermansiaceae bacterium]MDB4363747.1 PEP-CTERM sorting domain-containing protein [Akkermansiaceae bacterium]MDB4407059.1 PEP-CTERM sorting domain-containing protein [bacterium]
MKLRFSVPALVCFLSPFTHAATISWNFSEIVNTGGAQNTTGTGFLATSGTFLYAENTGGAAASLDGISFGAGTILFGGGQVYTGFHAAIATNPITGSGAYGNAGVENVTLGTGGVSAALISGQEYRVQAIVMDGRGDQADRTFEVDGLATDHALGISGSTWGNALLATGTFVADSATQTFSLDAKTNTGASTDAQLNGLVLHSVPEPSSSVLLGLAGLALAARRRR